MLFSFSLEFQYKWKTLEDKLCCLQSIDLESSKGEYEILFPSHAGMLVLTCPQGNIPDLLPAICVSGCKR